MGDDSNDLGVLARVGMAAAPTADGTAGAGTGGFVRRKKAAGAPFGNGWNISFAGRAFGMSCRGIPQHRMMIQGDKRDR